MPAAEVIVKVHIPVQVEPPARRMTIYNEDRSLYFEGPVDEDTGAIMQGATKKFFYATIKDGALALGEPAPDQEW
jgi:hypothetical protein